MNLEALSVVVGGYPIAQTAYELFTLGSKAEVVTFSGEPTPAQQFASGRLTYANTAMGTMVALYSFAFGIESVVTSKTDLADSRHGTARRCPSLVCIRDPIAGTGGPGPMPIPSS